MSAVTLVMLIVPRDLTEGYGLYFREAGIRTLFSFPCGGTAGAGIRFDGNARPGSPRPSSSATSTT